MIQNVFELSPRGHGLWGSVSTGQGLYSQPVFQRKEVPESHCSQQYWVFEHYKYELPPSPQTHTHTSSPSGLPRVSIGNQAGSRVIRPIPSYSGRSLTACSVLSAAHEGRGSLATQFRQIADKAIPNGSSPFR